MVRVNDRMLDWADVIFAMDDEEQTNLKRMFLDHPALERIVCLDIPDRFAFNDPELVRLLEERVPRHLSKGPHGVNAARSGSPTQN